MWFREILWDVLSKHTETLALVRRDAEGLDSGHSLNPLSEAGHQPTAGFGLLPPG